MAEKRACAGRPELALLVDGGGSAEERRELIRHIAICHECGAIVFERQKSKAHWRPWRLVILTITGLAAILGVAINLGSPAERAAGRVVEGRLSGDSGWAPFRPQPARRRDAAKSSAQSAPIRDGSHALAINQLIIGESAKSLSTLLDIPQSTYDASMWSDLAAVYIDRGAETSMPAMFVEAIAAADAALTLKPQSAEARFNRALAIEYVGLRDLAAAAWRDYLAFDTSGRWADEATEHLQRVTAPVADFSRELERSRPALARGSIETARRLVALSPLEARLFVETDALAHWGGLIDSNAAVASQHLTAGRVIASELRLRGDATMADAVEVIDRSTLEERAGLAHAHNVLARARAQLKSAPTDAEPLLREASVLFARSRSPMSALADYYAAIAVFDQGRRNDAMQTLRAILPRVPETHLSLRALVLWQLGLCDGAAANWGPTIRSLDESAAIFDRIGETMNAAFVRQILSEVYDAIGDHETAWTYRATVMHELGMTTTSRTETAVAAIAYDAAQRNRWRVALSMLNLEIEITKSVRRASQEVAAYLRRAVAKSRLDDRAGASQDLAMARRKAALMRDPALRERAEADISMVGWIDASTPRDALAKLTAAIEFHRTAGRDMYLPMLHLQRARAYRAIGDTNAAQTELESGIKRLERDRQSLPDVGARFGIFDTSSELFEEAIASALARNDVAEAFRYSERGHARALLDLLGALPRRDVTESIDQATAIIEISSVVDRIVIFVAMREGVRAIGTDLTPQGANAAAVRMRNALARGDDEAARREGRVLYDHFIAPVSTFLRDKNHLVLVPSSEVASLPWGALQAPGGDYLVEQYALSVAPSAAVHLAIRPWRRPSPPTALIVAAASSGNADLAPLTEVRTEARAVAMVYANPALLEDEEALAAEVVRQMKDADVIHFAGHGTAAIDGMGTTFLATFDEGSGDALTVRRIESLRLRRAPLVVLAACNTARGELRWSEGPLSVARAFLVAGAPTVIATLWPIDDARAAEFFPRFHEHLAQGLSPRDALRTTQIESIRKPGNSPSMWAAAQVVGL